MEPVRLRRVIARGLAASALLAASLCGSGCGRNERPDILLVVVDTFRADHASCYGYSRPTTPRLDSLAREGVLFERAYTTAPWTLPAFGSIVTSLYPWEHGASNDRFPLDAGVRTLAEILRGNGYATAAVVSHIYTSSLYRFDDGFDRFEEFGITKDYRFDAGREPVAAQVAGKAVEILRSADPAKPFFLMVHFFDPHWEYGAPEGWKYRFTGETLSSIDGSYETIRRYLSPDSLLAPRELSYLEGLYDGEIRYVDAWIDTLLAVFDDVAPPDRSVVIITADHGEEFQDHRSMGHAFTFYDEVLHVPMILRDRSRVGRGVRIGEPVSVIDILPSLLQRADIAAEPGARGRSLYDSVRGGGDGGRVLFAGTTREARYGRAALRGGSKYIWSGGGAALYRPLEDRAETTDRAGDFPAESDSLAEKIGEERPPGAWMISWAGTPGDTIAVEGTVKADGMLVDVVPVGGRSVRLVRATDTMIFFTALSAEAGGIAFTCEPPGCAVTFSIRVDGEENADRIRIGPNGAHPPKPSFGIDPAAVNGPTLERPAGNAAPRPGEVMIWKDPGGASRETIDLGESEKKRLEALGYF